MEKPPETESSELLGEWDVSPSPVKNPEGIIMVSDHTSSESEDARSEPLKETTTRVSDKERASTSAVPGRRVLPPFMDPSYEWGGGKWKEDGRKSKKKEKEKEIEKEKEQIIPFKEIIKALLRNSGAKIDEDEDEEKGKGQSCVETLKSKGFKFP